MIARGPHDVILRRIIYSLRQSSAVAGGGSACSSQTVADPAYAGSISAREFQADFISRRPRPVETASPRLRPLIRGRTERSRSILAPAERRGRRLGSHGQFRRQDRRDDDASDHHRPQRPRSARGFHAKCRGGTPRSTGLYFTTGKVNSWRRISREACTMISAPQQVLNSRKLLRERHGTSAMTGIRPFAAGSF